MPNPLPPGWKTATLSDLFSPAQLKRLEQCYQQSKGDVSAMIELVTPWFMEPEMVAQLKAKGLLAAYAVYAIPFHYCQARGKL